MIDENGISSRNLCADRVALGEHSESRIGGYAETRTTRGRRIESTTKNPATAFYRHDVAAELRRQFLFRTSASPKNGDTYLVKTSTYLVGAAGDKLTSRPTVPFSALNNLPLVLFCRPSSWRNHLEQLSSERDISLNVVLEADSLSLQTQIVAGGGIYTLLGPYAIAAASKNLRLKSSRLVGPTVSRHIALAMSRHGELTLACRTVMQVTREIASSGAAGLPVL